MTVARNTLRAGAGGDWNPTNFNPASYTFDPTSYGMTFKLLYYADDPNWAPPANRHRVNAVRDASGNGLDAVQATAANKPAYMKADTHLGGRGSIRGGNNTFLVSPSFTALTQPVSYVYIGYLNTPLWETASTGAVALDNATTVGNNLLWLDTGVGHAGKVGLASGTALLGTRDLKPGVFVGRMGTTALVSRNGTTNLTGNAGTNSIDRLVIGQVNSALGNYANWGAWGLVALYNGDITAHANWAQFLADAQAYYNIGNTPALVAIDGDSRGTNYPYGAKPNPSGAEMWPAVLGNNTTTPVLMPNFSVAGQTQASMNADAVAQVDALYNSSNLANIAMSFGGINDLPTDSAATIETNIQDYCTTRRTAGFRTVVATIFPASTVSGATETKRVAVNTWLRANWASFADALVDLDGDSRLQTPGNTTYFLADGVHLTPAGHAVVAELVRPKLTSVGLPLAATAAVTDPASLSPQLWLDASVASSITSSGGLVSQWNDLSGNANHVTASSTARPTTGATTQNGLNVLDFDGTANVMVSAASVQFATQTWYIAAKLTTTTNPRCPAFLGPRTAAGTTLGPYVNSGSGNFYVFQGGSNIGPAIARTASDVFVWGCTFNGAGTSTSRPVINDVPFSLTGTLTAATPASTDRVTIGSLSRTSTPFFWQGSIFEVLIFSGVHSTRTMAAVQDYLAQKWTP